MDPENDESAAMAAMMGFSSFGAQDKHLKKKRKYNTSADAAFVDPHIQTASTGSNNTPLGTQGRSKKDTSSGANADEIDLDGDDEGDESAQQLSNTDGMDEKASEETVQGQQVYSTLPAAPAGLPQRPAPGPETDGRQFQGLGRKGPQHGHQKARERNERWFEDYYDPSSNENPWRWLESSMGMDSRGTWLAPGHAANTR